ncbi:MAG: hypothetical protein K6E59_03110 [Bacilli bacterium]|nr:hypothetical protein [Bacilli bacterium]
MTPAESTRFRLIYSYLQPRFDNGSLILLDVDKGYLFFTSALLHKKYGKKGSGQWGDIPDRFFFALNYAPVVKNGEKKRDLDIELFDYGYKEEREALLASIVTSPLLSNLEDRKGYTCLARHRLLAASPKKSDADALADIGCSLVDFLGQGLEKLEAEIG